MVLGSRVFGSGFRSFRLQGAAVLGSAFYGGRALGAFNREVPGFALPTGVVQGFLFSASGAKNEVSGFCALCVVLRDIEA